jgi:hypothetical protein
MQIFSKKLAKTLDFFAVLLYYNWACAKRGTIMPIFVAQTARYAMMREVATCKVGFSAEYVRFQTGRQEITVF